MGKKEKQEAEIKYFSKTNTAGSTGKKSSQTKEVEEKTCNPAVSNSLVSLEAILSRGLA